MRTIATVFLIATVASAQVSYDRIRKAASEPGSWLTYSGNYEAHRFSPLTELTPANVIGIKPIWVYQAQDRGSIETTPLVFDGVMYVTEPPAVVTALDLRTGRRLWRYQRTLPNDLQTIGFGRVNRGVAVLGDMVYVGTLDAHLVALDAKSGAVRWDAEVADYKTGHCITVAPLAIDGKIITGISGGEAGIRGFIDAYDAKTGKRSVAILDHSRDRRAWKRFAGTPRTTWKTGGGSTWVTGAYDPDAEADLLGRRQSRAGLERRSAAGRQSVHLLAGGARRRYREISSGIFSSHLTTCTIGTPPRSRCCSISRCAARLRKVVAMANRNAFYYLLDRVTGEFLLRACRIPNRRGRKASTIAAGPSFCPTPRRARRERWCGPACKGATNWFSPSYDSGPQTVLCRRARNGLVLLQGRSRVQTRDFLRRRRRARTAWRRCVWSDTGAGCLDRKTKVGVPLAIAAVGGRAWYRRRSGVRRIERRKFLRARRDDWKASMGLSRPAAAWSPTRFRFRSTESSV